MGSVIDPRRYNDPDRPTLSEEDVARVASAVLALTREVRVLTDRMQVMQELLARRGLDIAAEIDAFEPDPAMRRCLNGNGKALVGKIVRTLTGIGDA